MGLKFHVFSLIFLILTSCLALGTASRDKDIVLTGVNGWTSIPVAFSNGNGTFKVTNKGGASFPGWAAEAYVKVLTGDFNGDGKTDIAVTGGSGWTSIPVAFSNGDGTFKVTNKGVVAFPGWTAEANVKVLPCDFNGDGKTDIAVTGGSGWTSIPVAFSNGDGTFKVTNKGVASFPGWAAQANVKVLTGDFNEDGKTDIAVTGVSGWTSIPVAFSNGDGTFKVTNKGVASFPGWAAQANVKVLTGDFSTSRSPYP